MEPVRGDDGRRLSKQRDKDEQTPAKTLLKSGE